MDGETPPPAVVLDLEALDEISVEGLRWRPLRRALGLTGFGTNAYAADAGQRVIEDHDETGTGDEELYVVLRGAARFTLGDEDREVAAGAVVFYGSPGVRRGAVATADGTLVLAIGGQPGSHPPSAWEHRFAAEEPAARGDRAAAAATVRLALADHPDDAKVHFDLARHLTQAGEHEPALRHLRRAADLSPEIAHWAARESDLDRIRDRPGFPRPA